MTLRTARIVVWLPLPALVLAGMINLAVEISSDLLAEPEPEYRWMHEIPAVDLADCGAARQERASFEGQECVVIDTNDDASRSYRP